MISLHDIKDATINYLTAARELIVKPGVFFAASRESTYLDEVIAAAPAIGVFALGLAFYQSPWLLPLYVLGGYAVIALWAAVLKYAIIPFGQKQSFGKCLQIASSAALALSIAWIPQWGAPLACVLLGFWSYKGLVGQFQMHSGAALAATFLPVVVLGVAGDMFSFIFLWIAGLTSVFSR